MLKASGFRISENPYLNSRLVGFSPSFGRKIELLPRITQVVHGYLAVTMGSASSLLKNECAT
jgi:hypothetical protein